MNKSGDGIFDIAFAVDDCRGIFAEAVARGAVVVKEPHELADDSGSVVVATIRTVGRQGGEGWGDRGRRVWRYAVGSQACICSRIFPLFFNLKGKPSPFLDDGR